METLWVLASVPIRIVTIHSASARVPRVEKIVCLRVARVLLCMHESAYLCVSRGYVTSSQCLSVMGRTLEREYRYLCLLDLFHKSHIVRLVITLA